MRITMIEVRRGEAGGGAQLRVTPYRARGMPPEAMI
jgi:hypothetical protein